MWCEIERYSHFFRILHPPRPVEDVLVKFAYTQSVKGFVKEAPGKEPVLKPVKIFAGRKVDKSEYRFHINQFHPLMDMMNRAGIDTKQIKITDIPIPTPAAIDINFNSDKTPRDYQLEAINYILDDTHPIKLVGYQTGKGKGLTVISAICKAKIRTGIVILPTYIEKWCAELIELTDLKPKDIMVVQGSAQLNGIISLAQNNQFDSKIVVFSSRTLQNYITAYEENLDEEHPIRPDELFPLLGIGWLLIDETHQHLHAMFKILLHTHLQKQIAMTATLISDDRDVERIHRVMYPTDIRFNNIDHDCYINVFAIAYSLEDPYNKKIRTEEWGSSMYSHNAFERSILRRGQFFYNYMAIINKVLQLSYFSDKLPGDKAIIYASTIEMCGKIVEYLKIKYPNLDIRRYCEEDPYENILEPDIRVTTIQSGGTAIDIPGLRVGILTVSIKSAQANLQALGRLRKLPDRDVKYYYLFCESLPKQALYHNAKLELFSGKVKSIKALYLPMKL